MVDDSTASAGLTVLAAICLAIYSPFWYFDIAPFSNEKTAYRQFLKCTDSSTNQSCQWRNLPLRTFRVEYAGQMVVEREVSEDTPGILPGCVVFDRNNWQCRPYGSVVGFADGKYIEADLVSVRGVSKLKWWSTISD